MGHIVSSQGVEVDPEKVAAVSKMKSPRVWTSSWTTKTSITESASIGLSEWHGSLYVNRRHFFVWHWRNYFPKTTMRWKSYCIRKQNAQQK